MVAKYPPLLSASDLAAVQQGAAAAQRASSREIKSLRLALDERDRQISLWQESERQTLAEAVRAQRTASEKIAALEEQLEAERQSRETAEQEAGTLRTKWDEFEARREHHRGATAREKAHKKMEGNKRISLMLSSRARNMESYAVHTWSKAVTEPIST